MHWGKPAIADATFGQKVAYLVFSNIRRLRCGYAPLAPSRAKIEKKKFH
jgi:hypothetical protein